MANLLTQIRENLEKQGIDPNTNPGRTWLLSKMKRLVYPTRADLFQDRQALKNRTIIGRLYFFFYNPKLKEILPYWDRFPLVLPIMRYHDSMLGLNLHYISPKDRLVLLTKLAQFATGSLNDEGTRLRLSYPTLKAAHRAYEATPCIKKYLFTHVKSRFMEIPAPEWMIAASLPLQSFRGKSYTSSEAIWEESKEKF